jgi:hypothetical protein
VTIPTLSVLAAGAAVVVDAATVVCVVDPVVDAEVGAVVVLVEDPHAAITSRVSSSTSTSAGSMILFPISLSFI